MKEKIFKIKILLAAVFFIGFIINGIFITIYNVDRSVNIDEIALETKRCELENSLLNEKIITKDSLTAFSEIAQDFGFGLASKVIYLDQADAVAEVR